MRFLDLAVAGLIGVSSIAGLMVWNPQVDARSAEENLAHARLRGFLTDFTGTVGLWWLQRASPSEICSRLAEISNSTLQATALVDSVACDRVPSFPTRATEVTLDFRTRVLVLVAWFVARR